MFLIFAVLCTITLPTWGLRFTSEPVTVDSKVLMVGRPARLTCNFVKYRTENVREIKWFVAYTGFRSEIFRYIISTGQKKGSAYPFIKTDAATVTEKELTITLQDFRAKNMTFACEVESMNDNGYGKLKHNKKVGESVIQVVDNENHELTIKTDPSTGLSAAPGKPVSLTCVSRGADPSPQLSLMFNGQNLTEMYSAQVVEINAGSPKDTAIKGTLRYPTEDMFDNNELLVKCVAHFGDAIVDKKEITLRKSLAGSGGYDDQNSWNSYSRSPVSSRRHDTGSSNSWDSSSSSSSSSREDFGSSYDREDEGYGRNSEATRRGRVNQDYNADVIHSRLMDLVDPARHVHPGIPYDFFAGYILMTAEDLSEDSSYKSVNLLGELPHDVETELSRNYGRVNKLSETKMVVKLGAPQVLNKLGTLGYRVSSSSMGPSSRYVWTLERKNFKKNEDIGQRREF